MDRFNFYFHELNETLNGFTHRWQQAMMQSAANPVISGRKILRAADQF